MGKAAITFQVNAFMLRLPLVSTIPCACPSGRGTEETELCSEGSGWFRRLFWIRKPTDWSAAIWHKIVSGKNFIGKILDNSKLIFASGKKSVATFILHGISRRSLSIVIVHNPRSRFAIGNRVNIGKIIRIPRTMSSGYCVGVCDYLTSLRVSTIEI